MKATQPFDLTGQIAMVTGAAYGLGLAIGEVPPENRARVLLATSMPPIWTWRRAG